MHILLTLFWINNYSHKFMNHRSCYSVKASPCWLDVPVRSKCVLGAVLVFYLGVLALIWHGLSSESVPNSYPIVSNGLLLVDHIPNKGLFWIITLSDWIVEFWVFKDALAVLESNFIRFMFLLNHFLVYCTSFVIDLLYSLWVVIHDSLIA